MVMTDKVNTQVDSINRYLNTTTGREKLCRLIQYFARFYAFYLYRCNAPYAEVERWANLKQHIGNGRKLFRLLKPVEFVQAAAQCLDASDEVLHVTGIVKHLGNALYYSSEVFVLTTAIGFYKPKNIQKITTFGQKCWFFSLLASIVSGLQKYRLLKMRALMIQKAEDSAELKAEENAAIKETPSVSYQLLQDIVDIVIPLGNLGWLSVDEGIIGLAGIITSFMAMKTQWDRVR